MNESLNIPTTIEPTAATAIAGAAVGVAFGVGTVITYINSNGIKIELTSFETREARFKMDGDARELFNAALGIEAKGFDATETWDRYNAIADSYIGKTK